MNGRAGFRLRSALPADARAVARCVDAAYGGYVERIGKPPGPMLEDYAAVIREHDVFVAISADEVIGILVLIESADGLLLDNLAVDPARQGGGIGRALIDLAEREARRRGFDALDLYTHERMVENIALYGRLGYRETDRRTEHGYARVYLRKTFTTAPERPGRVES